ncbi:MAG TPA: cytochrome c oxidase subunit 3 [Solirubrobacteraceae bacterium]
MTDASAGEVPRPAHVTSSHAAAAVDRGRQAQPSGWWGMVLFVCSEVTLFGTLIGSYFYLNFGSRRWPPSPIAPPEITGPVVATAVLVATVPLVALASRAARHGRRWSAVRWIAVALVVQTAYLAAQVLLIRHDLRQFTPQQNAYGSIYFTLLFAHHAHVLLGLLLDATLMYKVARHSLTNYWLIGVRGLALYWYVVAALAVVVLFTVLSPSL